MSVKVNLLPPELQQRAQAERIRNITIGLVGVFVLLLAGLYAVKLADVNRAREERDDAQLRVAQLEEELAELEEFRVLAEQLELRNDLLAAAMAREISWARVLNDLSLAFPSDSSLLTLSAASEPPVEPAAEEPAAEEPAAEDAVIAGVSFTGYSVARYAPGVESVLLEFAEARGYQDPFLQTAGEAERGSTEVTSFNGSVDLNEAAYTDRYVEGLPPEVAE